MSVCDIFTIFHHCSKYHLTGLHLSRAIFVTNLFRLNKINMAMSKVYKLLSIVTLEKPHFCPGFYCEPLDGERYPFDGVHFNSDTGEVPTYICLHYPGMCQRGAEVEYFLLKCLAKKLMPVDEWILLYPNQGDKNRFVPEFSDQKGKDCIGFEIRTDARDRAINLTKPNVVQAPCDFNAKTKKIHTIPCLHLDGCKPNTRSWYALMHACIRNPTLLVKDGLGKYIHTSAHIFVII